MRWPKRVPISEEELYDLKIDPQELNNLSGDPKYLDELTRLRGKLLDL